jgi:hypothetical protein
MTTIAKRVAAYTTSPQQQAWKEYLDATQHSHPLSYDEVEAWAWRRLQTELKSQKATPK